MKEICSYCQREYGTISLNNKPIFMTYDHIIPLRRKAGKNRQGIVCRGDKLSTKELNNLLTCCNECNRLKDWRTLSQFYLILSCIERHKISKSSIKYSNYLNYKLIETIKNSIKILHKNNLNPLILVS